MRKNVILILICSSVLFVLFQNFSVPNRVLPASKKFASNEIDPAKRVRDYVKHEIGDEAFDRIEKLKSKLRIQWGAREPASIEDAGDPEELSGSKTENPLKYTFANMRTFRVRDADSEINCRVDDKGLNLSFQRQLSSTSSYIIEHNTERQKSQAKFQLSW